MRTFRTRSWLLCLSVLAACGGGSASAPAAETAHEEAEADEDVHVVDVDAEALGRSATDTPAAAPASEPRSAEAIRAEVHAHLSAFAHCYDQLLATVPDAHGRVLLRITVAADGVVGDVTVAQSTIASMPAEMGTCMQDAARTLHFGAHAEATIVNYPFEFSTDGAASSAAPPPASSAPPASTTAAPPPSSTAATPPPSTTTGRGHH